MPVDLDVSFLKMTPKIDYPPPPYRLNVVAYSLLWNWTRGATKSFCKTLGKQKIRRSNCVEDYRKSFAVFRRLRRHLHYHGIARQ